MAALQYSKPILKDKTAVNIGKDIDKHLVSANLLIL